VGGDGETGHNNILSDASNDISGDISGKKRKMLQVSLNKSTRLKHLSCHVVTKSKPTLKGLTLAKSQTFKQIALTPDPFSFQAAYAKIFFQIIK
jgi:hypothetical protein